MEPIDIFITTYERQEFTRECIEYIKARTKSPYKITVLDNGGNEWLETAEGFEDVTYVPLHKSVGNAGIHFAWNVAVSLAKGKYFITTDPDLLVPLLEPDWLSQMVKFMEDRPDYGAISMMPHIFIGAVGIDPVDPEDVKDRNMCGAVFRIMDTDKVRSVRGWDLIISSGRNHEERTICSRLHEAGYKTGIASRVRAYHNFGKNWGYPEEFTPEMQKHNPDLKDYVLQFDHREAYDNNTWLPK